MIFELTVLGSSSALPTSVRFPTAQVLNAHERFFLIDCGEGTQIQLRKAKIKISKINNIFISHLHGDHIFGLFGLLATYNLLGRKTPIHIYGHSDLQQIINFYLEKFAPDNQFEIKVHPVVKRAFQSIYKDKVVEVYAFPLKHRVPTFGYLFRECERPKNIRKDCLAQYPVTFKQILEIKQGADLTLDDGTIIQNSQLTEKGYNLRSYAYCSDTAIYEKICNWIGGVDLLYHEATFMHKDKDLAKITSHSTARQAAEIALKSKAKKLLIGHFSSRYKSEDELQAEAREVFRETYIAEELKTYSLPLIRLKN